MTTFDVHCKPLWNIFNHSNSIHSNLIYAHIWPPRCKPLWNDFFHSNSIHSNLIFCLIYPPSLNVMCFFSWILNACLRMLIQGQSRLWWNLLYLLRRILDQICPKAGIAICPKEAKEIFVSRLSFVHVPSHGALLRELLGTEELYSNQISSYVTENNNKCVKLEIKLTFTAYSSTGFDWEGVIENLESHCIVCSATLQHQICPNLGEAILWDGVDWVDGGEDKASDGNFGLMTRQIHHHHSTFSPPGSFGFVPFQVSFCRFGDNVGIPSSLHLVTFSLTFGFVSFQTFFEKHFADSFALCQCTITFSTPATVYLVFCSVLLSCTQRTILSSCLIVLLAVVQWTQQTLAFMFLIICIWEWDQSVLVCYIVWFEF